MATKRRDIRAMLKPQAAPLKAKPTKQRAAPHAAVLQTAGGDVQCAHLPARVPGPQRQRLWVELDQLRSGGAFTRDEYKLFGKAVSAPRVTCAFSDAPGAGYAYTGQRKTARAWPPELRVLRDMLAGEVARHPLNFALVNYYADGRDYIGAHSDDEKEHVAASTIVSVSLGGARRFVITHKQDHGDKREVVLADGDVLTMTTAMQRTHKHAVPKTKRACAPRYNITFRQFSL
jgi:alkylated DNA repair dioxygenase AlkB